MLSVVIIGTGNVAKHLFRVLVDCENIQLLQVVGRNREAAQTFSGQVPVSSNFGETKDADVYIIAVSDGAIAPVSQKLIEKKGLVAHTSGATDIKAVYPKNRGVFYPLQTFSGERDLDFENIPICIEAETGFGLRILQELGESISKRVRVMDSPQRKQLHLAAVFANNFTNYLYHISETICRQKGLSFTLLQPLILETALKVEKTPPFAAQTGPAKRGDMGSVKKHLALLKDEKHIELYNLLSESITMTHEKKL